MAEKKNKKLENLRPFKSGDEWNGNKNGRPKGSMSFKGILNKILAGEMTITEAGEKRKLSKKEVIGLNLVNMSLNPNVKPASRLKAKEMIKEWTEGKAVQPIGFGSEEGGEQIKGISINFK